MKKIIFIKTIQILVIDGIMLAFLAFKEELTWDWILIYSGWLIFFHPVLLTYLSNQLCDHFSQLYSQIRPRFWRFVLAKKPFCYVPAGPRSMKKRPN